MHVKTEFFALLLTNTKKDMDIPFSQNNRRPNHQANSENNQFAKHHRMPAFILMDFSFFFAFQGVIKVSTDGKSKAAPRYNPYYSFKKCVPVARPVWKIVLFEM